MNKQFLKLKMAKMIRDIAIVEGNTKLANTKLEDIAEALDEIMKAQRMSGLSADDYFRRKH